LSLAVNLIVASLMVSLTVIVHFSGLLVLLRLLASRGHRLNAHQSVPGQFILIVSVVLGIFFIHSVEIWLYALLYRLIGALPDFEAALYFSTVAFTTVGFGDIVLPKDWRIISAIEAANGFILFGWSIAFLLSLMGKLRTLEHDWLKRPDQT
jgi:hypothetical protein